AEQEKAGGDYEAAKQIYLTYLEKNPDSHVEDEIANELGEIDKKLAEKDEWAKIAALSRDQSYNVFNRRQALKRYISDNPSGAYVGEAKKLEQVAQIDGDVRLATYNLYLLNHPKGKHRKAVEKLISDMSEVYYGELKKEISVCESEKKWEKCIQMCTYFVSMFKGHRRWDEMVVVRAEQEKAGGDYEAAKQIYLTYLEKNPDSHVEDEIANELDEIDKKLAEKDEWAKIAALSRDQSYNIFNRKQALKRYIADNPSGAYIREAQKLLGQLESEKRTGSGYRKKATGISGQPTGVEPTGGELRADTAQVQKAREMARAQLKGVDRFVANGDGTFTDSMTGLMWAILDSTAELGRCVDYRSAEKYVKGLTTGGHRDWQMPTSSDLAGIYKSKPFFPVSGARWYWTSKTYVDGHHVKAGIVTTKKRTIFKREYADVEQCGAVRTVRP
ncbi:MAG: DUF1566 domain-containing protein, partial [Deltaproteobacteria bacterium]|nr:DUF1566 domain-containing protein [Deltaproteobacteria bacterium]